MNNLPTDLSPKAKKALAVLLSERGEFYVYTARTGRKTIRLRLDPENARAHAHLQHTVGGYIEIRGYGDGLAFNELMNAGMLTETTQSKNTYWAGCQWQTFQKS